MPTWKPTYKIRRSTRILSFAVKQNHMALQTVAEACYLLKRYARANAHFQKEDRRISTMTTVASSYSIDPDTGNLRYKLWGRSSHTIDEYPDIHVFTTTVAASGSTDVWEPAVDKYTFISGEKEYAFDIYQNEMLDDGTAVEDAVYIVFNTPPMTASNVTTMTYGTINPSVSFESMQPIIDDEYPFQKSLFGFDQWKKFSVRIRSRSQPHCLLVAFPGTLTDFSITDAGMLRDARASHWTTPSPYSPVIVEHDVIVRQATGQRYQVVNYTPIYIEDILVSQHFDLVELDPRSSIYQLPVDTT